MIRDIRVKFGITDSLHGQIDAQLHKDSNNNPCLLYVPGEYERRYRLYADKFKNPLNQGNIEVGTSD